MHTVISFAPLAAWLIIGVIADRWSKRPAARARWAKRSLRDKIARQVRALRIAIAILGGWAVLYAGLYATGHVPSVAFLGVMIMCGIYLAIDLYLLHLALAARRTYNANPAAAYIAEVRNAFGSPS